MGAIGILNRVKPISWVDYLVFAIYIDVRRMVYLQRRDRYFRWRQLYIIAHHNKANEYFFNLLVFAIDHLFWMMSVDAAVSAVVSEVDTVAIHTISWKSIVKAIFGTVNVFGLRIFATVEEKFYEIPRPFLSILL